MASRRRINPSFSAGEKLSTKKERQKFETPVCPPLVRRFKSQTKNLSDDDDESMPRPISCLYDYKLSSLYNPNSRLPYIKQVFQICNKIGEGSYANVYSVKSKEDGKAYAIKVIKRKDSSLRLRYAEAYRLERLGNHPNIIDYYGAWEESDNIYIQLELSCSSLDKYARSNHNISEAELWDILLDMILAAKHLHDKQFIHLDIKPDNIMISSEGVYKLGDFGLLTDLVQFMDNRARSNTLSDGDAKYLAKEVLEGKYSYGADIFSLGITILELATDLVLPSDGPLWHQMRSGVLPEECTRDVPTALLRIIKTMMSEHYQCRPTVNQLLKVEPIKSKLLERKKTERFNYYENWCLNHSTPEAEKTPVVNVYVKVNESAESEIEDRPLLVCNSSMDTTPCVTPPRRVSQIMLHTV